MPRKRGAEISQHHGPDWCHLCGKRKAPTADVRYAENAENDGPRAPLTKYVRICVSCAVTIAYAADPSGTYQP